MQNSNDYSVLSLGLNARLYILTSCFYICILVIVSCSGVKEVGRSYYVNEQYDEYDGATIVEQRYNTNRTMGMNVDGLSVRRKTTPEDTSFFLVVYKNSTDPKQFANDPLKMKIDGVERTFEYVTSDVNVIAATNIQMRGYYGANRSSIKAIAQANDLKAKISTVDGHYTVVYDQRVVDRIKQFVASGYRKE